jgi:hypothetical protein
MSQQSRGYGLSSLLSKYITNKLENELREYLLGIKFNVDVGTVSKAQVQDLRLRPDALDKLNLPICVMPRSKVGLISTKIPLAFSSKEVVVKVKNVKVVIRANVNRNWTDSTLQKVKNDKLEDWEKK